MAEKKDKDTDLQKIKELIEIMKENELVEVEIKHGDNKILVKRSLPQQPVLTALPMVTPNLAPAAPGAAKPSAPAEEPSLSESPPEEDLVEIKSPLVGTFYSAPSPDSESYVEVGSRVEPQTVVCIIEAMKVMNEIKAETSGVVAEILVKNGQAVEYGQALFKVKPD